MKIVVFADSHGDVEVMTEVIEEVRPDMVIHLGDHVKDAIELKRRFNNLKIEYVKGNTDLASSSPSEKLIQLDSLSVFITHGDEYYVKEGYDEVVEAAASEEADIVLFGHTHMPCLMEMDGIKVMNPGRIGRNYRKAINTTYGIIEINGGKADFQIVDF